MAVGSGESGAVRGAAAAVGAGRGRVRAAEASVRGCGGPGVDRGVPVAAKIVPLLRIMQQVSVALVLVMGGRSGQTSPFATLFRASDSSGTRPSQEKVLL